MNFFRYVLMITVVGCVLWPTITPAQSERFSELMNAGNASYRTGNYSDARKNYEAAYQEALKFGSETGEVATALNNLAEVYRLLGGFDKCKLVGDNHPEVATILNIIGNIRLQKRDYEGAVETLTSSLTIYDSSLPSNHSDIAMAANNLGRAHQALRGAAAQAGARCRRAAIYRTSQRNQGPVDPTAKIILRAKHK